MLEYCNYVIGLHENFIIIVLCIRAIVNSDQNRSVCARDLTIHCIDMGKCGYFQFNGYSVCFNEMFTYF